MPLLPIRFLSQQALSSYCSAFLAIDRVALLFGRMAEQLAGYQILGFDADLAKVEQLLAGQSYIGHLPGPSGVGIRANRRLR